jgi:hypothetical protein
VNGKMESRKDMEFLLIKMETDIKDNSKIQWSMVKEFKNL